MQQQPDAVQLLHHSPGTVSSTVNNHSQHISSAKKRTVLIAAGAFLFVAALLAIVHTPRNHLAAHSQTLTVMTPTGSASIDTAGPPDTEAPVGTDPPPPANSNRTSVNVNGQNISVTANGSTSKTIVDSNGTTTVNVSNQTSQHSSGTSSSSQTLNVSTNSSYTDGN